VIFFKLFQHERTGFLIENGIAARFGNSAVSRAPALVDIVAYAGSPAHNPAIAFNDPGLRLRNRTAFLSAR